MLFAKAMAAIICKQYKHDHISVYASRYYDCGSIHPNQQQENYIFENVFYFFHFAMIEWLYEYVHHHIEGRLDI